MTSLHAVAAQVDSTSQPLHWLFAGGIVLFLLALVALFVVVLVSVLGSDLSAGMKVLWVLFIFWMPVVAWFAWYLIGRPDSRRRRPGPAY
ncbi:PLDc N-terminal domain-containing protein [Kineosporia babensis]|uniref:PLDc N-terminal domain-containing protein n=1 Tax=Kineosporia babensis TaxID=499548 RepID=A0A9X1NG61_9ACTN|nr:PLDc N-terminal domain-containing protein [Kineosporia babensis]MCD5313304.1 PLDc N-terminal domain-containing protein [Kineosporia babensis]